MEQQRDVSLIIRSAVTMGALPGMDQRCEWLPVDACAASMLEIEGLLTATKWKTSAQSQYDRLYYNMVSPRSFDWEYDLLPALAKSGLPFQTISLDEWRKRLRTLVTHSSAVTKNDATLAINDSCPGASMDKSTQYAAGDAMRNPALKLIDFFEATCSSNGWEKQTIFEIGKALEGSKSPRDADGIIGSGLLAKTLSIWMKQWN